MRSVVLLGAGASFGSEVTEELRPPLGGNLFKCLEAAGGMAAKLPCDLKQLFRDDFEEGMAEFYKVGDGDTARFQMELAFYLSKFSPSKESVYFDLLRAFEGKKVTYVSLNYDLLLERAILKSGRSVVYSLQTGVNRINLLKIHGSSNMWPRAEGLGQNVFKNCDTDIVSAIDILHPDMVSERFSPWRGVAPVIAMYAKGKSVRNCPEHVVNQQKMWARGLSRSSRLFIVGVRVVEDDDHIWRVIGEFTGEIVYFGRAPDKDYFDSWLKKYPANKAVFKEMSFNQAVSYIQEDGSCK